MGSSRISQCARMNRRRVPGVGGEGVLTMWCNTQVTFSPGPASARSESELEVNPLHPNNLVGASKRFTDPRTYAFTMACYSSFDAGETWTEAAPLVLLGDP